MTEYKVIWGWGSRENLEILLNTLAGERWAPKVSMSNGWLILERTTK